MESGLETTYRMLRRSFMSVAGLFVLGLASGVALNLLGNRDGGDQVFRAALWLCALGFVAYAVFYWRLCKELHKNFVVWVVLCVIFLPFAFPYSFFAMRALVKERLGTAVAGAGEEVAS